MLDKLNTSTCPAAPASGGGRRKGNFLRFMAYVRPYARYIVAAAIGGVVKFLIPLIVPQLTRYLIDNIYSDASLPKPERFGVLFALIGFMFAIYIFIWLPFTYIRHYFSSKAGHRSVFDLRCDLYDHILRMPASFFNEKRSGGIVSRLIGDVTLAQNLVGTALTNVWMDAFSLVFVVVFLFKLDPPTAAMALITFPLYLYFFKRLGAKIKESSRQVQEEIEIISGNAQEKILGSTVVRAFGGEPEERKNFRRDSDRLFETTMKSSFLQSANITISGFLTSIAPLIVTLFGGSRVINGDISVGTLVALGMYLPSLYLPLQRFSELNVVFANSMAAIDRIFEIIDSPPDIADAPDAQDAPEGGFAGGLEFRDVSFSYEKGVPVLDHLSLSIAPGERIAIVGSSGSGKTTVSSLIPRFWDVDAGAVLVDGINVKALKLRSLRKEVGIVLQEPVLFSGTVMDNILYGNPGASESSVIEAAKLANAQDFIMALPRKFNTEVGERGVALSGGQKQRITIARAFLKNPRILILDEATSALDAEAEGLIQEALERLMERRTTIVIAHRLSTVANADRIIVLEKGRIVESGSHSELLASGGRYHRFMATQLRL